MKRKVLFWLATAAMVLSGCKEREYSEFLDYSSPVDLSDVARCYERYHANEDSCDIFDCEEKLIESKNKNLSEDMIVPEPEDAYFEFTGDTCMIRLPQYADSEHPFLSGAEDFYNSSAVIWNVWSNFELWYRFTTNDDEFEGDEIIDAIESIDAGILTNDTLRRVAEDYKAKIIKCMRANVEEWDEQLNPYVVRDSIMDIISSWSDNNIYEEEDSLNAQLDSVLSHSYALGKSRIERYNKASENERIGVVIGELMSCSTFDEQVSLLILWANNNLSMGEDEWIMAVAERLMQSGKYSPLLYDVWITWRCMCQSMNYGASRDSSIPNDYYNGYRRICYISCLHRLEKHPRDPNAMYCAFALATRSNMNRFGSNMFGNEAIIEMIEAMPLRFDALLKEAAEDKEDEEDTEDE